MLPLQEPQEPSGMAARQEHGMCACRRRSMAPVPAGALPQPALERAALSAVPPVLQAIHDRVLALGFDTCAVDLFSVDSQFSQESPNAPRGVPDPRGVMVLVTGQLTFQAGPLASRQLSWLRPCWSSGAACSADTHIKCLREAVTWAVRSTSSLSAPCGLQGPQQPAHTCCLLGPCMCV